MRKFGVAAAILAFGVAGYLMIGSPAKSPSKSDGAVAVGLTKLASPARSDGAVGVGLTKLPAP